MQKFIRRLIKFLAYTAAGLVILLAVAVGLFRLFLPKLPEYQEELKVWASDAIGMQVEFSGMDARWGLSGPELNFYDAELIREATNTRLLAAEEVSIGVAALRLLRDRTVVVDRIFVRDTALEVRELGNGQWYVQGTPLSELRALNGGNAPAEGAIDIVGEDIELQLVRLGDQRPTYFAVSSLDIAQDAKRIAVDASIRLPDSMGRQISVAATQVLEDVPADRRWDVTVAGRGLKFAGITALVADRITPLASGSGSLDVSFRYGPGSVESAVAEFSLRELASATAPDDTIALSGRIEFRQDLDGSLLALDRFLLESSNGSWPSTSIRLETGTGLDGQVEMLDLRASYLNAADAFFARPWLPDNLRDLLDQYAPSGALRDLTMTVSELDGPSPDFAFAATLEEAGFAASDGLPGLRNLSGSVRADRSGGLADIDSVDVEVSLPGLLSAPVELDDVYGTLIWRQSDQRITLLSDSIVLRNADMSTNSNVELTLIPGEGPVIDLSSTFSITDIAAVKLMIPDRLLKPKLYDWFQNALVSGQIQGGRARLYGPLKAFPFDNGEGRMLIEANIRNTEFKYLPNWPAAELLDVDVVLDNLHLYTHRNQSMSTGSSMVNAKVDIRDLREPVLTIDGLATGTLDTIRRYASASPLSDLFAGQLEEITVAGDATLKLDLMVPFKRAREFEVSAMITSVDGSVTLPGLRRPITELAGSVTIERDTVSSEALTGVFLERPVSFDLMPAPEGMTDFSMVLNAIGSVTAEGIVEGLGLPAGGILGGLTEYTVSVFFPKEAAGSILTIEAASDLVGLAIVLPEPFAKAADVPLAFAGAMTVGQGARRIDTTGGIDDDLRWQLGFERNADEVWDLDRGVLSLGPEPPPPADTRGLHIRGKASDLIFEEWLALGDTEDKQSGFVERLRSIDLTVTNLRLLGQHLVDHRVRLDRSARDWLVQFDGADVTGSVFVPYDFTGDRPLVIDMERLVLPGDPTAIPDPDAPRTDPRELPAISLRAREFALGDRFLGAVEAEIARVDGGLESTSIVALDDSFEVVATASWLVDEQDPLGSRTSITATLTSTDIKTTMSRLGYSPGLAGDDMSALLDLQWSGGPGEDFLPTLNGEVQVRMGVGQFEEVEPGAGRVFGLMSIVALPRRLSLDFTDVFGEGFGFDKIEGTFRLVDGETYTCNLSLEAPAADIAIVGRAGLVSEDYEQTAVIAANVGNALPVVVAAAAGPQAAIAALIFSQVFKKPLQDMGTVYYSIDGSWDMPVMALADTERFAATSELAGCVMDAQPATQAQQNDTE